jgi:hypothetical protein
MATARVTTTVEVPNVSSLRDLKARRALPDLCMAYRDLRAQIKALEDAAKPLAEEIAEHASRAKVDKLDGEGWRLSKCAGRKTLSKERLLEKGVAMTVIEYATVEGLPYYKVLGRDEEGNE